jgi:hypothetical protein
MPSSSLDLLVIEDAGRDDPLELTVIKEANASQARGSGLLPEISKILQKN